MPKKTVFEKERAEKQVWCCPICGQWSAKPLTEFKYRSTKCSVCGSLAETQHAKSPRTQCPESVLTEVAECNQI